MEEYGVEAAKRELILENRSKVIDDLNINLSNKHVREEKERKMIGSDDNGTFSWPLISRENFRNVNISFFVFFKPFASEHYTHFYLSSVLWCSRSDCRGD